MTLTVFDQITQDRFGKFVPTALSGKLWKHVAA